MIAGAQVNAIDLVTGGSGTSGDPWTGWDTNIDWNLSSFTYVFPKGVWAFSAGIQIDGQSISIIGLGGSTGTEFKFTGGGRAFTLNSTATRHLIQDVLIRGNALATDAIFLNIANHGIIRNVRVVDFTDAGLRTNFTITELIDTFVVSGNDAVSYSFLPDYGIYLDASGGNYTTTVTILNPMLEILPVCGIYFGRAILNTVIGGTSESNGIGIQLSPPAGVNTFINIDLEQNTTDLQIDFPSNTNSFYGVPCGVANISGSENYFFGGRFPDLTIDGDTNQFFGVYTQTINNTGSGTIFFGNNVNWSTTNNVQNSDFEIWSSGTTSPPDGWSLSGAGATVARESAIKKIGSYSAKLTRSGTDALLVQDIASEKGLAYWQGRLVNFGAWVYATAANNVYLFIQDGVTEATSTAHPGNSTWVWLSVQHYVDPFAIVVRPALQIKTTNGSGYIDGAILTDGPLTPNYTPKPTVAQTAALASSGTGTIKMGTGNAANSAGFLSMQKSDGTIVYVPYFSTDMP